MQRPTRLLCAMILCALFPVPALAGAWLRDEGAAFLSFSITLEEPQDWGAPDGYGAFYGEYGLTPDLTLGLDLGTDESGKSKAFAFAVLPFKRDGMLINFEIGAGVDDGDPALRPGVSIGRPITLAGLGGWFNVDTRATITQGHDPVFASDITLGLITSKRTKMFVQLQQGGPMSDPDWLRVASSVIWQMTPDRHLELGVTTGITGAESLGLKLGIWQEF
ncbi:hypothetical protein OO012_01640 [Rhodobacteraceae bacterium KMM 6894]|nr:hypothetical protein [Rhodobacteraceae bacterium KMM 6894]